MKTKKKVIVLLVMALFMVAMMSVTAFAAEGDVAGAVEDTWIGRTRADQVGCQQGYLSCD